MSEPTPNRIRFQFSLRALFALMTAAIIACFCGIRYWEWWQASAVWDNVNAAYYRDEVTWDQLAEASRRRLATELRLPFADSDSARRRHAACMDKLLADYTAMYARGGTRTGEWPSPAKMREAFRDELSYSLVGNRGTR